MGRTGNSAHRAGNEVGRCRRTPTLCAASSRARGTNKTPRRTGMPLLCSKRERSIAAEIPVRTLLKGARQASPTRQADALLTEIAQQMEGPVPTKWRQQLADPAAKAKHLVRIGEGPRQLQLRESSADEKGILRWGREPSGSSTLKPRICSFCLVFRPAVLPFSFPFVNREPRWFILSVTIVTVVTVAGARHVKSGENSALSPSVGVGVRHRDKSLKTQFLHPGPIPKMGFEPSIARRIAEPRRRRRRSGRRRSSPNPLRHDPMSIQGEVHPQSLLSDLPGKNPTASNQPESWNWVNDDPGSGMNFLPVSLLLLWGGALGIASRSPPPTRLRSPSKLKSFSV